MNRRSLDQEESRSARLEKRNPAFELDSLESDEDLAVLCKALGHPARIAILRHLARIERCVCGKIVDILPLAQSTVSQHLKILKEAGLVRGEVDGPRICYCLDKKALARFRELLGGL